MPIDLRPPGCHCESAQTGRRLVTTARLPVNACNRPNAVHNAGFQELGSSADIVEEEPKEGTTNGKAELLMSMGQGHPSPSIRPKTAEPQRQAKSRRQSRKQPRMNGLEEPRPDLMNHGAGALSVTCSHRSAGAFLMSWPTHPRPDFSAHPTVPRRGLGFVGCRGVGNT